MDFVARLGVLRAVVERGGISAAAVGLGVSVSTASRRCARSRRVQDRGASIGPLVAET